MNDLTRRLARVSAAHPGRTLGLWGAAVVASIAVIALLLGSALTTAHAVGSTARIITGAALIIIMVFVGFASGDQVEFQQMGFGVAVSLLIDATLIRLVLMPAVLALLGEHAWYLPSWLAWLPHVEIEGRADSA